MVGLAKQYAAQEPMPSSLIAAQWHIPEKYLVHILLQLKHAGLVRSVRGAQGGYLLACPPEQITLLDMVQSIDGPVLDPLPVDDAQADLLRPAWMDVSIHIVEVLRGTSLRKLADSVGTSEMYYI